MAKKRSVTYKDRQFTVTKHPLCWLWHEEGSDVVFTAPSEVNCYLAIGAFVAAGRSDQAGLGFDRGVKADLK